MGVGNMVKTSRFFSRRVTLRCVLAIVLVVVAAAFIKYRGGDINYVNSDATWHVLMTMQAYDEVPVSEHRFLPLFNYGGEDDRYIRHGMGLSDDKGNYYYTSFTPAGFVLPYFFVRIFRLPVNERSLYCFNTLLYVISAVLWFFLMRSVYRDSKNAAIVTMIGVVVFIFSPEVFHGMGAAYWHQSVMQVTLTAQILAYWKYKTDGSKAARIAFYILALLNPYIEWTGYVANAGFALAELGSDWKKDIKRAWLNAIVIGVLTVCSFGLMTLHYISAVSPSEYFATLYERFFARNFTSGFTFFTLLKGYVKSFWLLWVLFALLLVWCLIRDRKLKLHRFLLMFVMAFPVLENVIMKGHAVSYPYDRMKVIFLLSFLTAELSEQLLEGSNTKKEAVTALICATVFCCIGNLVYYVSTDRYVWDAPYRESNEELAEYLSENYPDSVMVCKEIVRGYTDYLFHRGIYELSGVESTVPIAEAKGKRYVIEIIPLEDKRASGNMYNFEGAIVFDLTDRSFEDVTPAPGDSIKVTKR